MSILESTTGVTATIGGGGGASGAGGAVTIKIGAATSRIGACDCVVIFVVGAATVVVVGGALPLLLPVWRNVR